MRRVVNGHYADGNSTRDIVEISMNTWELFAAELLVSKKLAVKSKDADFSLVAKDMLEFFDKIEGLEDLLPDNVTIEMIKEQYGNPRFYETMKLMFEQRIMVIDSLSLKAKLMGVTFSVMGITPMEYEILINVLQGNITAYHGIALNKDSSDLSEAATVLNKKMFGDATDIYNEHPLMDGIGDDGKERKEARIKLAEKMTPLIHDWLRDLNQPYEGETLN